MVNLTTLAPDIVAAILDDALPNHMTLFELAVDPPALWEAQRQQVSGGAVHEQRTVTCFRRPKQGPLSRPA